MQGRARGRPTSPRTPRARGPRCSTTPVPQRHRARRAPALPVRHRRPRHARRRPQPDRVHARRCIDGMGGPTSASTGTATTTAASRVVNAICALEYGADRVHGTALGIGERVGNAALDQLLVNLKLLGELARSRTCTQAARLSCELAAQACTCRSPSTTRWSVATRSAPRPACTPRRSSRREQQGRRLAGRPHLLAACPPAMFGTRAGDRDRPMSGVSNVKYWLGAPRDPRRRAAGERGAGAGQAANRTLTESEVPQIVGELRT